MPFVDESGYENLDEDGVEKEEQGAQGRVHKLGFIKSAIKIYCLFIFFGFHSILVRRKV